MSAQKIITSQHFLEIEKILTDDAQKDLEAFDRAFDDFADALKRLTSALDSTKYTSVN